MQRTGVCLKNNYNGFWKESSHKPDAATIGIMLSEVGKVREICKILAWATD